MMIRTSIAAVAVSLAAVAPSFADGYGYQDRYGYDHGYDGYHGPRTPYPAASPYDDGENRLVVDGYSGRVTFADHCWPRRQPGGWGYYGRRVDGPDDYGYYGD